MLKWISVVAASTLCLLSPARGDLPPLVQADTSTVKTITLDAAPWAYVPDVSNLKLVDGGIAPPPKGGIRIADSIFTSGSGLEIQFNIDKPGNSARQWVIERVDLSDGSRSAIITLPPDFIAAAYTGDGKRAAITGNDVHSRNSGRVYIEDLQQNGLQPVFGFMPYPAEDMNSRQVSWARFIDKDHLMTCSGMSGRVVMWDISNGQAKSIWSIRKPNYFGQDPLLTPGNKYIVMLCQAGTCFINALTGEMAGLIDDPLNKEWNAFEYQDLKASMSADGQFLLRSTASHLDIFSLKGQPARIARIYMPPATRIENTLWLSDNDLLLNRKYLVDIDKGMIVWTYGGLDELTGGRGKAFCADRKLWVVNDAGNVSAYIVPDEQVKKAIAALDLDKVMAVRPGMKVSLDVDIPDEKFAATVKSHFEEELKDNNMTIADAQPVVLRIKFGNFSQEKVVYRDMNGPNYGREQAATVSRAQLSIAYEVNGKILWDYEITPGAPLIVSPRPGQDINSAIRSDQNDKWRQVQYTRLPTYVSELRDPPGFGQTLLAPEEPEK